MESRSLATSPKGKLGSAIDQTDMSTAINGISMVIWSLVAAKAKQGYDASGSKDTQTVGSALERVGSLILMIVVAGGLNIYSQMESQQQVMIKPKVSMPQLPILTSVSPSLELNEPLSSHHEGGVAAAAFKAIAENPEILKQVSSFDSTTQLKQRNVPASQRGQMINRPISDSVLSKVKANKQKRVTTSKDVKTAISELLKLSPTEIFAKLSAKFESNSVRLTDEQYTQNVESGCAFLLFIAVGAISMAYFVTFKTYHTALAKMDTLKELLSNPNARVATREQGTKIMDIVNRHQEKAELKQTSSLDVTNLAKKLSETSNNFNQQQALIEALIAQNTMLKQQNTQVSQYQAPKFEAEKPKE